ncbi:double-stranded RNA-binding protein 1-like [Olea europaea var. sylvestris]|uniref:double-stranded RNA-binding protein 1-like n=1 Tax=Olea europaea var. sylvestris TaxID=158386 RepID=UPI000C1D8111|nr:double-stranded RNA-binding protein 1-like [Olea europaea var. sylvestris]XP_022864879.1 double-stranded RNA-binding protein 1-like [Olea europaea var. sylvestris]
MEAGQVGVDGNAEKLMGASQGLINPASLPAQVEHFSSPRCDPTPPFPANKGKSKVNHQGSQESNTTPSVSNFYVFKSRLQEYAQRAGLPTPVYETIKEGPSHEPSFRSTVIVNNVRYDSLPGFFNRKAAEQSAAEVALMELANSVDPKFGITQPVHETGLCKNWVQEYAQKMNLAVPIYECHKDERQGNMFTFYCTLEIGGIKYIGGSANTKKEAEIKAARTALLAIQSAASGSEDQVRKSVYTVLPYKKKAMDLGISTQETAAALKATKNRLKKQQRKKRRGVKWCKCAREKMAGGMEAKKNGLEGVEMGASDSIRSESKVANNLEAHKDGQAGEEMGLTDAGPEPTVVAANTCDGGSSNGNLENGLST